MRPNQTLVGAITEAANEAIGAVVSQLTAGRIEQEPDFTSQFVGEIRGEIRRAGASGYSWDIKVLTDRGRGAQERTYGADLLVVQHFETDDYRVTKGFLAQAKLEGRAARRAEMVRQCERMLAITPDAFIFRYGNGGIAVAAASGAVASSGAVNELRWKPFNDFLLDFLTSFVGDARLSAATAQELETLRAEHEARMALHIAVTEELR